MATKILIFLLILAALMALQYLWEILFKSPKKHLEEQPKSADPMSIQTPSPNQRSGHNFIDPDSECCRAYLNTHLANSSDFDATLLTMAENSSQFEDMSLDGQSSWINLYRCTKCELIWELASPSHGRPGHFRPLERP